MSDSSKSATFSEPVERNVEPLSVDRSLNVIANTVLKSKQHALRKTRKSEPIKPKVAVLRPTILISRSNDMATDGIKRKRNGDEHFLDENGNHSVFSRGKQSFATPKKGKIPKQSFFGQRSPQLLPFNSKAFSPSNVNKSRNMSVAEIIEGWPFKHPQNKPINNELSCKPPMENVVHTCPEPSIASESRNNEVNKENVRVNSISDERYPLSMYISPFPIVGRRPIRRKPQK